MKDAILRELCEATPSPMSGTAIALLERIAALRAELNVIATGGPPNNLSMAKNVARHALLNDDEAQK